MRQVYDEVLLLCPEVKTGGPEALHQLGYQIARHGGTARMVYYGPHSRIEVDRDILRCHADTSPMPAHFAQYQPNVLHETRLGPNTLVVYPEPLSKLAAEANGGTRAPSGGCRSTTPWRKTRTWPTPTATPATRCSPTPA